MSFMTFFNIGKSLAEPIEAVGGVLDKLVTTDKDRANAEQVMALIRQNPMLWQVALNQANASSERWFDSSWRSFIGWIGGVCLAFYFIPQFVFATFIWVKLCLLKNEFIPYPLNADQLMEIVYLLLGFGAYHLVDRRINH